MDDILTVSINSPDKLIWEGKAYAVSSINSKGAFDILPRHANFITIIENEDITVHMSNRTKSYTFPYAVIYAHNNYVQIYTL